MMKSILYLLFPILLISIWIMLSGFFFFSFFLIHSHILRNLGKSIILRKSAGRGLLIVSKEKEVSENGADY